MWKIIFCGLILVAWGMFFSSCNTLPDEETPLPVDTSLTQVSSLYLVADSAGIAPIILDSISKNRRISIAFGPFQYGHLVPAIDGRSLVYRDTSRKNWEYEITWFETCISGTNRCKLANIYIFNSRYKP